MTVDARAPSRLVGWWLKNRHPTLFGFEVSYHSRSDAHSKETCQYVMDDLIASCRAIRDDALAGEVCYEINHKIFRPNAKPKTLDLVIGQPGTPLGAHSMGIQRGKVVTPGARIILEAKACMTCHSKALPRLHDELSAAMRTSVACTPRAIMCGLVVVNASQSFISTENQNSGPATDAAALKRNAHNQPKDVTKVIEQLQSILPIRKDISEEGFDCLTFIVVDHDNEVPKPSVKLISSSPAPPAESPRHYDAFLVDICNKYRERFS